MALLGRNDLDAVGESDTGDDLRQLICSFQSAPGFGRSIDELEHHQLRGLRRQRSFGPNRPVPHRREHAFDRIGNRYEMSRCQRSAAVFDIVAYGATIGTEAPGARSAGRPMHTMSRELELVAGRLCDSPGCAASANP